MAVEKRVRFRSWWLPWVLIAPQLAIVLVFFFLPAGQAIWQSLLQEDPFGTSTEFTGLENFATLFADEHYLASFRVTAIFSVLGRQRGRPRQPGAAGGPAPAVLEAEQTVLEAELTDLREQKALLSEVLATAEPGIEKDRAALDEQISRGSPMTPELQRAHWVLRKWEGWQDSKQGELIRLEQEIGTRTASLATAAATRARKQADLDRTASQQRIFTVDVALDQVMTALKLTFMNLCAALMARYLGGTKLQLDTLIRGILTLPGERVRVGNTETIRIYRHDRDRQLMPLVDEACRQLTAKGLVRDTWRLRFELVEPPARRTGTTRAAPADTA